MSIDALRIGPGFRVYPGVHMKGFSTGGPSIPQYGPVPSIYAMGGHFYDEGTGPIDNASVTFTQPGNTTALVFISTDGDYNGPGSVDVMTPFNNVGNRYNGAGDYYETVSIATPTSYSPNAITAQTEENGFGGYWIAIVDFLKAAGGDQIQLPGQMNDDSTQSSGDTSVTFNSYAVLAGQVVVLFSGAEAAGAEITSVTSTGLTWRRRSSKSNLSSWVSGEFQTAEIWYAVNDTGIDITSNVTVTYAAQFDDQAAVITSWGTTDLLLPWYNSARAVPNPATNVGDINLKGISTPPLAPWYPMVTTEPAGLHNGKFTINSTATYGVPAGFTFANEMAWNFRDVDHTTVTNGNQTVEANGSETATYADWAIGPTDKVMFSVTMDVWNGNDYADAVGVGDGSMTNSYGGSDPSCYAVYDNGGPLTSDGEVLNGMYPYPVFQHDGAVIDVAVDRVNNSMWIRVDGGPWNIKEFTINSISDFGDNQAVGDNGGWPDVVIDAADSYLSSWRLFVLDSIYPDIGTQVIVGSTVTVAWGGGVTATVTNIIHDTGYGRWVFIVDKNVQLGFAGGSTASFAMNGGAHWISPTQFQVTPTANRYGGPNVANTTAGTFVFLDSPVDGFLIQHLNSAFESVGMTKTNPNGSQGIDSYAYLWHVTWADDTTDIVRLQWANNDLGATGRLWLAVVDTTKTGWNTPVTSTNYPTYPAWAAKMGTFTFPAKFKPYLPLIPNGKNNVWC